VLITKVDLLPYIGDFDVERAERAIVRLRGAGRLERVSVRTSQGLDAWTQWLQRELQALRERSRSPSPGPPISEPNAEAVESW
jgi:hydrogenase nickel incorporation protein HypB